METVAKPNRNAALESDSDDDMPLSDRLQSPSKPLNGAKEGAASPDRAAPLQPKVPGGQAAQAGGAAGLSGNPAGAEAKSAGASGKAPSDKGKASSEPKSKAEAYAAAAKPAGASQAGPSKASGGAKAGPSKASDGAKAGSSKASDGAQAGPSKASDGAKAGSSKASDGAQAGPSKASHGAKAGSSKAMEPGKTVGSQKAGLSKQAAMAGRSSSAGANGKASGAALAANGSLKRKASPVSDSSDSEDDQPLGMMAVPLKCRPRTLCCLRLICCLQLSTLWPASCVSQVCAMTGLHLFCLLQSLAACTIAQSHAVMLATVQSCRQQGFAGSKTLPVKQPVTGMVTPVLDHWQWQTHEDDSPLACSCSQGCNEDSCKEAAGEKASNCAASQEGGRRGAQAQAASQEACQAQAQLRHVRVYIISWFLPTEFACACNGTNQLASAGSACRRFWQ